MARRSWILLVAVGAIWGASFLLAAIALRELSPVFMTFVRTGLAALVMLPIAVGRGRWAAHGHISARCRW